MAVPPLEIRVTADTTDAESGLRRVETQMGKTATRTTQYGRNADAAAGSTANLAAQFNDIGVMLAAGQSPLLLAVQQGSQINQVMGQMGTTGASRVRALGTAFMSIISPANLLTLGIIAGGAALVQWAMNARSANDDAEEFSVTLEDVANKTRELNLELRRMRLGITAEEQRLMEAIADSHRDIARLQQEIEQGHFANREAAQRELEIAQQTLAAFEGQLSNLQGQLRTREQINNMARPRMRPMDLGADTPTRPMMRPMDLGVPLATGGGGGGGGGGGRSRERQREREIQAFITSLQTEREILEEWRVEQLELLAEYTDKELEAIGGKNEAKLRLEQEYQDRVRQIQEMGQQQYLGNLSSLFSNMAQIMQAGGEKTTKVAKAFAIAEGLINSYRAYLAVLADPSLVGRPFLRQTLAASTLAAGLAQVANIRSVSTSGGGNGGGRGGATSQPSISTQRVDINIVGGNDRDRVVAKEVINALNNAQRDGFRLDPRLIGV